MSARAIAGTAGNTKRPGKKPAGRRGPQPHSPLEHALSVMRDETKPAALRASMAKAALPYLHGRCAGAPPRPEHNPEPITRITRVIISPKP
jgi:hypothetical protein